MISFNESASCTRCLSFSSNSRCLDGSPALFLFSRSAKRPRAFSNSDIKPLFSVNDTAACSLIFSRIDCSLCNSIVSTAAWTAALSDWAISIATRRSLMISLEALSLSTLSCNSRTTSPLSFDKIAM